MHEVFFKEVKYLVTSAVRFQLLFVISELSEASEELVFLSIILRFRLSVLLYINILCCALNNKINILSNHQTEEPPISLSKPSKYHSSLYNKNCN